MFRIDGFFLLYVSFGFSLFREQRRNNAEFASGFVRYLNRRGTTICFLVAVDLLDDYCNGIRRNKNVLGKPDRNTGNKDHRSQFLLFSIK